MKKELLICVGLMSLTGCVSGAHEAGAGQASRAKIVHGTGDPGPSAARYSKETASCSEGAQQLMSSEELQAATLDWRLGPGCSDPLKLALPADALYPRSDGRLEWGSAHMLVLVDADGRVAATRAVCASDERFAMAAGDTVKQMTFSPGVCDGVPSRSAILLPLDFDPR